MTNGTSWNIKKIFELECTTRTFLKDNFVPISLRKKILETLQEQKIEKVQTSILMILKKWSRPFSVKYLTPSFF